VALLAQPGWPLTIVLLGLAVLLFPDGRPPSEPAVHYPLHPPS